MSDYKPRAGVDARTRDGRRASNPTENRYGWFAMVEGVKRQFLPDGSHYFNVKGFDLVADWPVSPAPTGPVRMVTRPEIVPGTYGRIRVETSYDSSPRQIVLALTEPNRVGDFWLTAPELRAAAETLSQLADAMEQESKL